MIHLKYNQYHATGNILFNVLEDKYFPNKYYGDVGTLFTQGYSILIQSTLDTSSVRGPEKGW